MQNPLSRTAIAVALAIAFQPASAAPVEDEAVVVVTATRFVTPDVEAPYASEIHTRKNIEASNATTLYDYLANHTSVQVMPSFGNRFSPKIDMRGFGIGDGYQNIVLSVDGQRLNNIDMSPPLIGAIPLAEIERIEITKGSGSVVHGDGATAGTIQIHTRQPRGVGMSAYAGSHGGRGTNLRAGTETDLLSVSASYDTSRSDGASDPDVAGHPATSASDVMRLHVKGQLARDVAVSLEGASARLETRYPGWLTLAQFTANPAQNGGKTYTHQEFSSDYLRGAIEYRATDRLRIKASHAVEDKRSRFVTSGWTSDYDYVTDDVSFTYQDAGWGLTGGYQGFDGTRIGLSERTRKQNAAWFAQGQIHLERLTLSLGARSEEVNYSHRPNTGGALERSHRLNGWDFGANYRIDAALTVFANYNSAFQAPDIDRFFRNGTFNQFIHPATARTLNLGLNHVTPTNRLKAVLFYADLENEIYYYSTGNWLTSYNTNIDASHKYGLELQDTWRATERLTLSANYAFTRAIIDRENDGGGAYDGKALPGVPRHSLNLGLGYRIDERSILQIGHVWRASTWAADDFDNNNAQKQRAYASTHLSYRHRRGDMTFFAAVENLFERSNGIWVRDDRIYPVNFSRNWMVGVEFKL